MYVYCFIVGISTSWVYISHSLCILLYVDVIVQIKVSVGTTVSTIYTTINASYC